jgi:molybdopterin-guanine dinucleotide biosynthesis protein MobB
VSGGPARVFGFAGWSGSGKTTLIERVIPRLVARGIKVSLIKHAHHRFDVDQPGKDSYRHRQAGCSEVLITSGTRWALMHELRGTPELGLPEALARLSACDLALVEGYKAYPRLVAAVAVGDWPAGAAALGRVRRWVSVNLALGALTVALATLGRGL